MTSTDQPDKLAQAVIQQAAQLLVERADKEAGRSDNDEPPAAAVPAAATPAAAGTKTETTKRTPSDAWRREADDLDQRAEQIRRAEERKWRSRALKVGYGIGLAEIVDALELAGRIWQFIGYLF